MSYFRFIFLVLLPVFASGQKASFKVVPLGVKGGTDESNLSAYLIAPYKSNAFISLDAGTINAGIRKAIKKHTFKVSEETVLKEYIKGYFISHAHLDHVSGLIINSPGDSSKPVYATKECMELIQNNYFNGQTWANFGDAGPGFQLKKYHFQTLETHQEIPVKNTEMSVTAFPLSHVNPYQSTAFLVKSGDNYALYFGDTGPDEVEKSDKLAKVWEVIAPLIQNKKLKGIFIEVSFPNGQPDKFLFGHLTPNWFLKEMKNLVKISGEGSLKDLKLIITHKKPPLINEKIIRKELRENNPLELKLIFPQQGKAFRL